MPQSYAICQFPEAPVCKRCRLSKHFQSHVFDFLIVAFAVFVVIKAMNAAKKKEETKHVAPAAAPEPSKEEFLLTEIRDLLKK